MSAGQEHRRGRLTIFMGYAAGVGKTYQMLEEAQELKAKGMDVVLGYFEPHNRIDTVQKAEGIELIPRKKVAYRQSVFDEMDTHAIVKRKPQVAIVDELPHTNVPGSENGKRWEDVQQLLDAGIDVLTTMNVQHLESLNDQIWQITGVRVRETIPDWIVQQADDLVVIDLTPRALIHRLERGVIYSPENAQRALQNFFREPTLAALRELALRQAAHEVEQRITGDTSEPRYTSSSEPASEKRKAILVYVTPDPHTAVLIRRAKRVSDFLQLDCFAVVVHRSGNLAARSEAHREAINQHLNFARNLHIETRILEGDDPAATVVEFGRRNRVAIIFLARPSCRYSRRSGAWRLLDNVIKMANDMQVVIVSDRLLYP